MRECLLLCLSAVFLVGGLGVILAGIFIKKQLSDKMKTVATARHIDNTLNAEGCSDSVMGDMNCGSSRYDAWTLTAAQKQEICLLDEAPASRAIKSASGWCSPSQPGCNKPSVCDQGQTFHYYLFSVVNPEEIMEGVTPELQELDPIGIRKITHKLAVDRARWDAEGVADWAETYEYSLLYPEQEALLNKTIVIPNALMFGRLDATTPSGLEIPAEHVMYVVAAAKGYRDLQVKMFEGMLGVLEPFFNQPGRLPDLYPTAEGSFLERIYRSGLSGGSGLTALLSNPPACLQLIDEFLRVPGLGNDAKKYNAFRFLCSEAYSDEISIAVIAKKFLGLELKDSFSFYEYQLGCHERGDPLTGSCKTRGICGENNPACSEPWLSQEQTSQLFAFFTSLAAAESGEAASQAAVKLLTECRAGELQLPANLCEPIGQQLVRVGRAFMQMSGLADSASSGYSKDDRNGLSVLKRMFPYFVQTTVRQAVGLGTEGVKTPVGGRTFNYSLVTPPAQPFQMAQKFSSKFGDEGLGWWVAARNQTQACQYDRRCTAQASWKAAGVCVAGEGGCAPNVPGGYDTAMLPATLFGHGQAGHGEIGATFPVFVSDFFLTAQIQMQAKNVPWRGINVNVWRLSGLSARTENCGSALEGLDCDSPQGTVHIGAFTSPKRGFVSWTYASVPHFAQLLPPVNDGRRASYNPADRVKILPCPSCPKDREFFTEVLTDHEMGTAVQGVRRLQVNTRIRNARVTGRFAEGTDFLLPLFWIEPFQTAKDYQLEQLSALHDTRSQYLGLANVLLIVGLVSLSVGVLLLLFYCKTRRKSLQPFDGLSQGGPVVVKVSSQV